jgi:hypothetical protein
MLEVDVDDLDHDVTVDLGDLLRNLDVALGQLGDVDQAPDALFDDFVAAYELHLKQAWPPRRRRRDAVLEPGLDLRPKEALPCILTGFCRPDQYDPELSGTVTVSSENRGDTWIPSSSSSTRSATSKSGCARRTSTPF